MNCQHFGTCGSCSADTLEYQRQLEHKQQQISRRIAPFFSHTPELFTSEETGFRSRMEFRILHQDTGFDYAMHTREKRLFSLSECHIIQPKIREAMLPLQQAIIQNPTLKERLYTVEFLSSQANDLLITLIYHRPLDQSWEKEARNLETLLNCKIIGRSRGQKIMLSEDFITEKLQILDNTYTYHHHEGGFTQPNTGVNEKMISWALQQIETSEKDLLELYCGAGNFTIPLASRFRKVLATEVSKTSIKALHENLELNNATTIQCARLNSEEVVSAFNKEREFRRLKGIDLDSYNISTVFVDPPRAGLDQATESFITRFDQILYISCNPDTLLKNLETLTQTHEIRNFALFDQFPYTHHVECGCFLVRKS